MKEIISHKLPKVIEIGKVYTWEEVKIILDKNNLNKVLKIKPYLKTKDTIYVTLVRLEENVPINLNLEPGEKVSSFKIYKIKEAFNDNEFLLIQYQKHCVSKIKKIYKYQISYLQNDKKYVLKKLKEKN